MPKNDICIIAPRLFRESDCTPPWERVYPDPPPDDVPLLVKRSMTQDDGHGHDEKLWTGSVLDRMVRTVATAVPDLERVWVVPVDPSPLDPLFGERQIGTSVAGMTTIALRMTNPQYPACRTAGEIDVCIGATEFVVPVNEGDELDDVVASFVEHTDANFADTGVACDVVEGFHLIDLRSEPGSTGAEPNISVTSRSDVEIEIIDTSRGAGSHDYRAALSSTLEHDFSAVVIPNMTFKDVHHLVAHLDAAWSDPRTRRVAYVGVRGTPADAEFVAGEFRDGRVVLIPDREPTTISAQDPGHCVVAAVAAVSESTWSSNCIQCFGLISDPFPRGVVTMAGTKSGKSYGGAKAKRWQSVTVTKTIAAVGRAVASVVDAHVAHTHEPTDLASLCHSAAVGITGVRRSNKSLITSVTVSDDAVTVYASYVVDAGRWGQVPVDDVIRVST